MFKAQRTRNVSLLVHSSKENATSEYETYWRQHLRAIYSIDKLEAYQTNFADIMKL